MTRRHRRGPLLSVAAVGFGILLLGACGGDDDDDSSSTSTTAAPVSSTAPSSAFPEPTVAPTAPATVTAPPTSAVYVTEGASVMVTNASRVDGAAGRMSERLAAVGFTMVEPGNYSLGTLETTKIYQDPTNAQALAVAESLKTALGGGDIEIVEMGAPPPVDTGDALGATVLIAMGNDTADKTLDELQGITTTTAPGTTIADATESTDSTESTTASTTA